MADLEKLAVRRDRGYLLRLVLGLAVGIVACVFLFRGLTGETTTGCLAGALLGSDPAPAPAPEHTPASH